MQKVFFILFFSIVSANLLAQQVYFVTIEADNKQPFSVQIGSKNYSSTPIGHLIIPNLKDNTYLLTIRFPRNEGSDQTFSINVNKKDKGYQLKKTGIRNWGLFDWQTMELIKPNSVDLDLSVNEKDIEKSKDAFARMMAAVVNDSAVLFSERPKPVLVRKTAEVKEIDQVSPEKANQITTDVRDSTFVVSGIPISNQLDSTISKDQKEGSKEKITQVIKPTMKNDTSLSMHNPGFEKKGDSTASMAVIKEIAEKDSLQNKINIFLRKKKDTISVADPSSWKTEISKISETQTRNFHELIFIDRSTTGKTDTINIIISLAEQLKSDDKIVIDSLKAKVDHAEQQNSKEDSSGNKLQVRKEEKIYDSISKSLEKNKKDADSASAHQAKTVRLPERKQSLINSDCRNFASDVDVDKLRVKMISESNLDERIILAKKIFRTKCFTTKQIRALTELFVNDKTRYMFFDAAYPFVSDSDNFKELLEFLTDEYYISRFKVMVRL